MKAMIFAAGLGTRLRPLTDTIPKALVPVGGKPSLQRVIERLRDAGIGQIIVNIHHFPDKIKTFLAKNNNFGVDIAISDESDQLLDTGGGLLKALPLIGDSPVLLHNADIATDVDLGAMIESHQRSSADATLLVAQRQSSRQLLFDGTGLMRGWKNLSTGELRPSKLTDDSMLTPMAFNGIHIIEPTLYPRLTEYGRQHGRVFSITPFYIDACQAANIREYQPREPYRWHDIGRPESLAKANEMYR